MKKTMERTALGEQILNHWRQHRPQMVLDLEKKKLLNKVLFETQETMGDLLYELVSVKKLDYQTAWELAIQEWMLPSQTEEPIPATNGSPASPKPPKSSLTTSSRKQRRGRRRATSE